MDKNRDIWKMIRNGILLIAGAAILGTLLLSLVYMIPAEGRIKTHAWQALEVFEEEGFAPRLWGENMGSRLDNFTDALMIQTAAYPSGGDVLEDGLAAKRIQTDGGNPDPIPDLRTQLEGRDGAEVDYGRYWHGYLVWLRPLLYMFDYRQIRALNGIIQILLLAAVLLGMFRREQKRFIFPFLVSWLSIAPWILPFSMQNSSVYNLTMFSAAVLLYFYDKIRDNMVYYFLIIGIGTAFFDLLTYPAVSFGIPFLFWMILEKEDKTVSFVLKRMIAAGAAWGTGYAGFWSVKWLLGGLVLHNGVMKDAVNSIKIRSLGASQQSRSGYVKVCLRNVKRLFNPAFVLAVLTCLITIIMCFFRRGKKEMWTAARRNAGCLLPAAVPFVWYLCTKNHADIHIHFTYRSLWTGVFAVLSMLSVIFYGRGQNGK